MGSMATPLISIVVPVYKVESYLMRCVRSIQAQTYHNIEIILVDDGSPDRSGELCDKVSKEDTRIIVLHKENGGLSDARNVGVQAAKGDWVCFVDSDDWIAPNMIMRLWQTCSEQDAQIAICNWCRTKSEDTRAFPSAAKTPMVWSGTEATRVMLYQKQFDTSAWAKLYPIELVKKYPYPIGRLYEDLFTTYKLLLSVHKVAYIDERLYFYWINPHSIMNQTFSTRMFDEIDAISEIETFVKENVPALLPAVQSRKFSTYSQVLRWLPPNCHDPKIEKKSNELWRWIKAYRKKMMLDKNARVKNRAAAMLSLFGRFIYCSL